MTDANKALETVMAKLPLPKPGYKTTEFYLNLAVTLGNLLLASGVLSGASPLVRAVAAVVSGLVALGYQYQRNSAKSA